MVEMMNSMTQWRKSSQLIDEVFGSDVLLRIAFLQLLSVPHPSGAESPWQNEEYIAFPSRRSVPGENSPFSARTGLITTSSRGIRHLGCATREKTRIKPKIRNRREAESKEDARLTGHADTSATISGRFLGPESDIECPSTLTGDLGPQSDLNVHPFHPPDRKPTKQVVMEATVPNLSTPSPSTFVSNSLFPLSGPSSSLLLDHIFLLGQPLSSVPHHSKASSPILDCTIDPWFYGPDIFFESQSQGNLDATVPFPTGSLGHEGSRRPSSAAATTSPLDGPAEPVNNDQEFVSEESAMSIEDLLTIACGWLKVRSQVDERVLLRLGQPCIGLFCRDGPGLLNQKCRGGTTVP